MEFARQPSYAKDRAGLVVVLWTGLRRIKEHQCLTFLALLLTLARLSTASGEGVASEMPTTRQRRAVESIQVFRKEFSSHWKTTAYAAVTGNVCGINYSVNH